jgi:hypothetical protein
MGSVFKLSGHARVSARHRGATATSQYVESLTVDVPSFVAAAAATVGSFVPRSALSATPPENPASHRRSRGFSRGRKVVSVAAGTILAGGAAYGATTWIVALSAGSSGEGQAATVQNLTITSVSTPSPSAQLYPGGAGDVVVTISNPNPYPVTLTGVNLPTVSSFATGYTNATLTTTQSGCTSSTSDVSWSFATSSSGSAHTLSSPLIIGASGNANNPLTVTFSNDASMTSSAPAACEGAFFSMPSLTGIAASGGPGTATSTPASDGWTS